MEQYDINQNMEPTKCGKIQESSILSQHEALRRLTLIKHRKVSTQLKLDMVQRQLSQMRRSVTESDTNDSRFYRLQEKELSLELRDLVSTLDREEQRSFFARRTLLHQHELSKGSCDNLLSSSNPALFTSPSVEDLVSRSSSRSSLKHRVCHLMSSPTARFKKRHLFGELRAVASLSSLNMKAHSPTHSDEGHSPKEGKSWKAPLRFLGNLVDNGFRRRIFSSTKRTKSEDNILDDKKPRRLSPPPPPNKKYNGSEDSSDERSSSSSSSSSSDDEDELEIEEVHGKVEEDHLRTQKRLSRILNKAPVMRKISNQKAQVDPAILEEIEEFEKMVARYLADHSKENFV